MRRTITHYAPFVFWCIHVLHLIEARRSDEVHYQNIDGTAHSMLNSSRESAPNPGWFRGKVNSKVLPYCYNEEAIAAPERGPVKCRAGLGPTSSAVYQWKLGRACHEYYQALDCLARFPGKSSPRAVGGGPCVTPILRMQDCNILASAVQAKDFKETEEQLLDMISRAPSEWMSVPSTNEAVRLIAEHLEMTLFDYFSIAEHIDGTWSSEIAKVGKQLAGTWTILLAYCGGTEERALEDLHHRYQSPNYQFKREALANARKECAKDSQLDLYAHYHPAVRAAQKGFKGVPSTLAAMHSLGVFTMDEDSWKDLNSLSDVRNADRSFGQLVTRMQIMMRSAGERGAHELQLALALASEGAFGDVEPEGGERRLEELKLKEYFESVIAFPDSVDKNKVARALVKADELKKHAPVQWVNADEMTQMIETASDLIGVSHLEEECEAKDLPLPCTRHQLSCVNAGLHRDCTQEDLENAAELRETCLYLGLDESCTMQDINDYEELKRACVVAGLALDCTREDVEAEKKRTGRCTELGFAPTCSQDDIDFEVELIRKCKAAALPPGCTQEDLDMRATTTSTTTAIPGDPANLVCSLTERTGMRYGVSFKLPIARGCNRVMCSYYRLRSDNMDKFFTAKYDQADKICDCKSDWESAHTFRTYRHQECTPIQCWESYAKDLSRKVAGGKKLLPEMKLTNAKHWSAECVPESEAKTVMPSKDNAKTTASFLAAKTTAFVAAALAGYF